MLSSLFPSSSSTQSFKTTFNPTSESVNFDQKIKKKGSSRVRAFKLWVVVGEKLFTAIPKATMRKTLNKSGRIKKVEFRRTMSSLQVKNQITKAFPSLKLDNPIFMKCVDLKMVTVDMESGYPCGSNIQNIASKESLYLIESASKVSFIIEFTAPLIELRSYILKATAAASSSDVLEEPTPKKIATAKTLIEASDEILAKLKVVLAVVILWCAFMSLCRW